MQAHPNTYDTTKCADCGLELIGRGDIARLLKEVGNGRVEGAAGGRAEQDTQAIVDLDEKFRREMSEFEVKKSNELEMRKIKSFLMFKCGHRYHKGCVKSIVLKDGSN